MSSVQDNSGALPGASSRGLLIGLGAVVLAAIGWAGFSTWSDIQAVGASVFRALWTLPFIIVVHGVQLLLSSLAWRGLFERPRPALAAFFRLRLIREGIDSLFPVAQVGGEMLAARMLVGWGIPAGRSGASVIVDVTLEVLSQAVFLLAGVAVLSLVADGRDWAEWLGAIALAIAFGGGALLAQRLGVLRLLEIVIGRIAEQFPALARMSLAGLHDAAQEFYRRGWTLCRSACLHLSSWALGAVETWIILRALGAPASLPQAFVIESLGMAARSAGFAIPGALAVQEGGFALAALSVGLPESAGLSLSLVKRAREVLIGVAGVALAKWGGVRSSSTSHDAPLSSSGSAERSRRSGQG